MVKGTVLDEGAAGFQIQVLQRYNGNKGMMAKLGARRKAGVPPYRSCRETQFLMAPR